MAPSGRSVVPRRRQDEPEAISSTRWSALTVDGSLTSPDRVTPAETSTAAPAMTGPPAQRGTLDALAADVRTQRRTALHALHVLEYALTAPAPRRHRTWLHRATVAVDALHIALDAQLPTDDDPIRLLDEIALTQPSYLPQIQRLQQELLDLTIAVASLREQIEPDPTIAIDPAHIRDRLSTLTARFRQHQAHEADLVYEATGRQLDEH